MGGVPRCVCVCSVCVNAWDVGLSCVHPQAYEWLREGVPIARTHVGSQVRAHRGLWGGVHSGWSCVRSGRWLCVDLGAQVCVTRPGWSHVLRARGRAGCTAGAKGQWGSGGRTVGEGGGGPWLLRADTQGCLGLPAGRGVPKPSVPWLLPVPWGWAHGWRWWKGQAGPGGQAEETWRAQCGGPSLGGFPGFLGAGPRGGGLPPSSPGGRALAPSVVLVVAGLRPSLCPGPAAAPVGQLGSHKLCLCRPGGGGAYIRYKLFPGLMFDFLWGIIGHPAGRVLWARQAPLPQRAASAKAG